MTEMTESSTPIRVALVEDDKELREAVLKPGLLDYGFDVVAVGSAGGLYRSMLTHRFDIVVLDVGLPDECGFDVAKQLRASGPIGIIMLTGQASDSAQIHGLGVGADVYLAKPIEIGVLTATINSLARRLQMTPQVGSAHWTLASADWQLVSPEGEGVELTSNERLVLKRLFVAAGEVVSREELVAGLGEDDWAFDPHRLEMLIHRLRRKVEQTTGDVLPLRAVRGRGYVLATKAQPSPRVGRPIPL